LGEVGFGFFWYRHAFAHWFGDAGANYHAHLVSGPAHQAFKPTRIYSGQNLPTALPDQHDPQRALDLLKNTPLPLELAGGGDLTNTGPLSAGGNDANLLGATAIAPIAAAPTVTAVINTNNVPTPTRGLPVANITPLLATNTPVIAALVASPTAPPTALVAPITQPSATFAPTLPPAPPPTSIPMPAAVQMVGFKYEKQQWNTCGPANLTQVLHFLGWSGTQKEVVSATKPNYEDRNVSPWELVNFVNENLNNKQGVGIRALMRVGGNLDLLKRLVANDFGVIIERGYNLPEEGWLGHYLTIQGYDDARGEIHGLDTYLGDRWEGYDQIMSRWQQFNYLFIVIYPQERERQLAALLADHRDVAYSVQYALSIAKQEAIAQPDNPFAWFNIGSSYTMQGRYDEAATAFDQARNVGTQLPWRFLWYQFTPYEAYYHAGDYGEVLRLTETVLNTSADLEESQYWHGMALAALGRTAEAQRALRFALNLNPNYRPASEALAQIENGSFRPPR
jgi:tetratricopeptide (TPR) repeat protein